MGPGTLQVIFTVPSLATYVAVWIMTDDVVWGAVLGGAVLGGLAGATWLGKAIAAGDVGPGTLQVIFTVPSMSAFIMAWIMTDDLVWGAVLGGAVLGGLAGATWLGKAVATGAGRGARRPAERKNRAKGAR